MTRHLSDGFLIFSRPLVRKGMHQWDIYIYNFQYQIFMNQRYFLINAIVIVSIKCSHYIQIFLRIFLFISDHHICVSCNGFKKNVMYLQNVGNRGSPNMPLIFIFSLGFLRKIEQGYYVAFSESDHLICVYVYLAMYLKKCHVLQTVCDHASPHTSLLFS